jgi:nucleotidyltransferase/DNA polymerase involved in DNA repair
MRRTIFIHALGVAAVAALCALPAAATLYKWVDANGRVVYSDQPPTAPGIKAETLNAVAPPSNPNAMKELVQKDADLRKRQADRVETAAKSDKDRVTKDRRAEDCARLADGIRQLSWGQVVIYRMNEKGEQVPMDDVARAKEKARLEGQQKEMCS